MANFATFIAPFSGSTSFSGWRRLVAFGDALPSQRCSGFVKLEADSTANSALFAVFTGMLSTRRPSGFLEPRAHTESLPEPEPAITLYLKPAVLKTQPEWFVVFDRIGGEFGSPPVPSLTADIFGYVVYRGIETARAKELLCPRLKSKNKLRGSSACDEELWKKFLSGEGAIAVKAGDEIGRAAPVSAGTRQLTVGFRTRYGMYDPGAMYEALATALGAAAPAGGAVLAQTVLQSPRPLIDPARSVDDVGADRLWPWSALLQYKRAKNLSYSDWRLLGDRQKAVYAAQLLARARPQLAPAATPRFEYDVDDMSNLFQLEAVVEFYMNLREPWEAATQPTPPGPNYRTINLLSLYGVGAQVSGSDVTLDGQLDEKRDMGRVIAGRDTIALDTDTGRPRKQYRIMGVDRAHKIVTLDAAPQVSGGTPWRIFHAPTLVLIDAFGSRVRGTRAIGSGTAIQLEQLTDAELKGLAKIEKDRTGAITAVTPKVNKFDTVDFPDAAGPLHAARVLSVTAIDVAARTATLQLDRAVQLPVGGSAWAIPAGLGAAQQDKTLRERKEQGLIPTSPASDIWGWDHYDGMMFLVAGEIRAFFPWTSYTSRQVVKGKTEFHSSIKGNTLYRFGSAFSTNLYINIALRVVDGDGFVWGDRATTEVVPGGRRRVKPDQAIKSDFVKGKAIYFLRAETPRFDRAWIVEVDEANNRARVRDEDVGILPASPAPYWIFQHAGVREARFYFTDNLERDRCEANELPAVPLPEPRLNGDTMAGKSGIFIHVGEPNKNGSHGCQVSPAFMSLRVALMAYHEESDGWWYDDAASPDRYRFRSEVHWEQHKPALLQRYITLNQELTALQKELAAAVADPMKLVIDGVLKKRSNAQLATINAEIKKLAKHPDGAKDSGDGPTQQELINALQVIVDAAADGDIVTLLKAEQAKLAAEINLRASPLKQRVAEQSKLIEDEKSTYGWDEAIHGEFWLIRPDERSG